MRIRVGDAVLAELRETGIGSGLHIVGQIKGMHSIEA